MTNLVIDIGNSSVKLAVFQDRKTVYLDSVTAFGATQLEQLHQKFSIQHSILSTVNGGEELVGVLAKSTRLVHFSHQTPLPLINRYQSPQTLGLDRLAGLIGARRLKPHSDVLVIDAGTCITYDLLDHQEQYTGGSISPGIHMRLKALHAFTGKLPLVPFNAAFTDLIGKNTEESILSGVIQGTVQEVLGFIANYQQNHPQLSVLLCGGDAGFFDTHLKNSIFAHIVSLEPQLVLIGLNEIIHHQHDE